MTNQSFNPPPINQATQSSEEQKATISDEMIPIVEVNDIQRMPLREPELSHDQIVARRVVAQADMGIQYVARRFSNTVPQLRALPHWTDDISERFGIQIYDRMYKDAEVNAGIDVLTLASTSSPIRFLPSVSQEHPKYDEARYISDFFAWMFANYTIADIDEIRTAMVNDALLYGSSTAEMTYGVIEKGKYFNYIGLKTMKQNVVDEINYLVDNFNNVIGLIPSFSGYAGTYYSDSGIVPIKDLSDPKRREKLLRRVIPRHKFMIMSWRTRAGDPRGQSALRAAYTFWWIKQEIINNMMSWVEKFSQPSVIGIVSPNAVPQCEFDENGQPIPGTETSPTQLLLEQLTRLSSASAIAVPAGTEVKDFMVSSSSDIWGNLINIANREIARSIHKQHLATSEGQYQSRAAADVHQDILSLMIILVKNWQIKRLIRDVVRPLTILNFGDDWSGYTPLIDVGDSDGFPLNPFEVSQLMGVGYLSEDQLPKLDRLIGIPQREPGSPLAQDQIADAVEESVSNPGDSISRSNRQTAQMNNILNGMQRNLIRY